MYWKDKLPLHWSHYTTDFVGIHGLGGIEGAFYGSRDGYVGLLLLWYVLHDQSLGFFYNQELALKVAVLMFRRRSSWLLVMILAKNAIK